MQARRALQIVGCHAEGERGDVIVGGVLAPAAATQFARMQAFAREPAGQQREAGPFDRVAEQLQREPVPRVRR